MNKDNEIVVLTKDDFVKLSRDKPIIDEKSIRKIMVPILAEIIRKKFLYGKNSTSKFKWLGGFFYIKISLSNGVFYEKILSRKKGLSFLRK